ncbi:unnamed protein product, partial [Brenthis ino]
MSVKVEDLKSEDKPANISQKGKNCLKSFCSFKTVVIIICVGLVVEQIVSCIQKLVDRPITTYTHFDFNKTIAYPSITFCREPPYKQDKLQDYGLYAHPRFTSMWRNFNFSSISLDELWEDITYNDTEFFVQYGLDHLRDNVILTPVTGFVMGRCYTMSPKVMGTIARATQNSGYSVTLRHAAADMVNPISILPPGYHVHVHYVREPYTEVEVYNGGLVDYLYINTGETVSVKLKVDEYLMISGNDDPCTNRLNYSANACTTKYVSDMVSRTVGCSGPWMESDLPYCNNFEDMTKLISSYINFYQNHECDECPRFCRSYLYNCFVTDRQKYYIWDPDTSEEARLQTQFYIHFNNMMVSVYEERYNYDWNLFLSDLGGSVGFLLGLSVIGLINIIEKIWIKIIIPMISKKIQKDGANNTSNTADVDIISKPEDTRTDQRNGNRVA